MRERVGDREKIRSTEGTDDRQWRVIRQGPEQSQFKITSSIVAYYDEIKRQRRRARFTAHGTLFVDRTAQPAPRQRLLELRSDLNYWDRVRWSSLDRASPKSKPFQLADGMFRVFFESAGQAEFRAFLADHEMLGNVRLPEPGGEDYELHLLWGMRAAFLGALTWMYRKAGRVELQFIFDRASDD